MNAQLRWGVGMTALAALAASSAGVLAFHVLDGFRDWGRAFEIWSLVAPPATLAATGSAWWLLRRPVFLHQATWVQSLSVTGVGFLFFAVLFTLWMLLLAVEKSGFDVLEQEWGDFLILIPMTMIATTYAVLLGGLPAFLIEYRVFRTMRRRWPPQQYDMSAPEPVA